MSAPTFLDRIAQAQASHDTWAAALDALNDDPVPGGPIDRALKAQLAPFSAFLRDIANWPQISSVAEAHALLRLSAGCINLNADGTPVDASGFVGMRDKAILALGRPSSPPPLAGGAGFQDEKIIEAAERFIAAEIGMLKLHHGPDLIVNDDERDRVLDASDYGDRLAAALEGLMVPATSVVGLRAKAFAAATWDLELLRLDPCSESEAIVASLLRDLIGDYDAVQIAEGKRPPFDLRAPIQNPAEQAKAGTPGGPHLDADLISVCDRYIAFVNELNSREDDMLPEHNRLLVSLERQVATAQARTATGIAAKAAAIAAINGDFSCSFDAQGTLIQQMLASLLHDAAHIGSAPGLKIAAGEAP